MRLFPIGPLLSLALACGALPVAAQVVSAPTLVHFQGKLSTSGGQPVPDGGNYTVTVSLWDAVTGGSQKWSQTLNNVTVKDGVFTALLTANTPGLFNGANLWLQVQVGADAAMTPRLRIGSVPFALKANAVPDGSVGAAQLASDAAGLNRVSGGAITVSADKVGIGVSAPTERLSLNGRLAFQRAAGDEQNAGKLDYRGFDASSLSIIGAGATSTNRNVRLYDTLSVGYAAPSGAVAAFNGNVGVGTSAPTQKLDVRDGNVGVTSAAGKLRSVVALNDALDMGYVQILNSVDKTVAGMGGNAINGGNIFVTDAAGITTATIDGTGEVTAKVINVTGGSDVAEPYNVSAVAGVAPAPGMVVVMDPERVGQMKVATRAYDPTVGGILSGANGIAPGITLRQKGTIADGEFPVASVGRVWCYADADANGPIATGTLLTTSATPGYAMRVTDFDRANGCVIGKAMSRLDSGKGLVLVLVSLR